MQAGYSALRLSPSTAIPGASSSRSIRWAPENELLAMTATRSAIERVDLGGHRTDVVLAQKLMHGQRQDAPGLTFHNREGPGLMAERRRRRLQMDRDGIVDRRADAACAQVTLQLVASIHLDDEGVEGIEFLIAAGR